MAPVLELGPIWRSMRRHRAFSLMVLEATVGFFIVSNLIITSRWFASLALPPSGHREGDLVEVVTRAPAPDGAAFRPRQAVEIGALKAIPGVQALAAVSSSQIDDRWSLPTVFWMDSAPVSAALSSCPEVERSPEGVVVGWGTDAGAGLSETVDLKFVAGKSPAALSPAAQVDTVVITRCLASALLGDTASAVGRRLFSNRRPPARIIGVIEDVRMRIPFLYQTHLTAIFTSPADGVAASADDRLARYLLRTAPGRATEVRERVQAVLAGGARDADYLVQARLFDLGQTHSAEIASGTVAVLMVVGVFLAVVAILGNLAVAAFLVGDRRRVIGVRRALGATRWDIFRYLLIENIVPTQIGNALGLLLTLLSLPMAQKLFAGLHIQAFDVVATALLLSLAGVAAKLLPAIRATRIPPSEVSRAL